MSAVRWEHVDTVVHVEEGRTLLFGDLPDHSVALDGYVQGPFIDATRRRFSFDHHGNCLGLGTRASCEQVMHALRLGLDPKGLGIFLNHLDADGIVSAWLLLCPEKASRRMVRTWVCRLGEWDVLGPGLAGSESGERFARFVEAPLEGWSPGSGAIQSLRILKDCLNQVDRWFDKPMERRLGSPVTSEPAKVRIRDGGLWVLQGEFTDAARKAYRGGAAVVLVVETLQQGGWRYGIASRSDLTGFPMTDLLRMLAQEELELQPDLDPSCNWGGGSSVGGSPRKADGSSSWMEPARVVDRIRMFLREPDVPGDHGPVRGAALRNRPT